MKRSLFLSLFLCLFLNFSYSQEDLSSVDLDSYLEKRGYFLSPIHSQRNEGYSSANQRKIFLEDLHNLPQVKKILEIGFNAGHSCEVFLNSPTHPKVVSFDINIHSYTKAGIEFMQAKFGDRFEFVQGDSRSKISEYANTHLGEKFDLIFIDGNHNFDYCVSDIRNCQRLAHKNTLVWIDDYNLPGAKAAIDLCQREGLIAILDSKSTTDLSGFRTWVIAKYQYLSESEKIFSEIYQQGTWGKDAQGQGTSGPGSSLEQGLPFVLYVQDFLNTHAIRSIVDIGCGDWVLAREINWGDCDYLGIDVVKTVIEKNQATYSTDKIHFIQLDVALEPLPGGDLLICKDVLMHLPNTYISHILSESKKFKYCIFIHDVHPYKVRRKYINDSNIGGFRYLDLTSPPFNLKPEAISTYFSGSAKKQVLLIKNE